MQMMAGRAHGGAEAFFERLAIALQQAGECQRLVIRADDARAHRLRAAGCTLVEVPFGGRIDRRTPGLLRQEIAEFAPRVVLTWMNRASAACPEGPFVQVGRLGGYYDLKYYRTCRELVANTRAIADYLVASGWPAGRVHYLPNFSAASLANAKPQQRAELATPDEAPLALALGRFHRNKGFDVLIEAMAQVPGLHLWLAGEGEEAPALTSRAASLGIAARVHFLEWQEDPAPLFAAADLLVCPSRHEPLGNVVLEAWAAQVPVVASASAGPRALVEDGETGLLVAIEDADALARALKRLSSDVALRHRLAAAARARWEAEFSPARVVGLYRQFLHGL